MENRIFIDIETIPPQGGDHLARIRAGITAPGQYKKPDSIAQWLAENGDSAAQDEFAKLGLNGLYGEVACLCFAVGDKHIFTRAQINGVTEESLLREAFAAIDAAATDEHGYISPLIPVGHNLTDFDLRFLFQRAIRYGIKLPKSLKATYATGGRYEVYDTMREWAGYKGYVKLKDLARELLGDDAKDIDGADVHRVWFEDPVKVIEHCQMDVVRVRKLYALMIAVTP